MIRRSFCRAVLALFAIPAFAAAVTSGSKPDKPLHVAKGGKVNLADYVVPGKTVVFDFYSKYCGPCVAVEPQLERLHAARNDVVVVKVDINRPGHRGIDWRSPVAQQYGLRSIPHFKVYGPDGKLLAEDSGPDARARRYVMGLISSLK